MRITALHVIRTFYQLDDRGPAPSMRAGFHRFYDTVSILGGWDIIIQTLFQCGMCIRICKPKTRLEDDFAAREHDQKRFTRGVILCYDDEFIRREYPFQVTISQRQPDRSHMLLLTAIRARFRFVGFSTTETGGYTYIQIPDHITSFHDAVAWSFGMAMTTYHPDIEV